MFRRVATPSINMSACRCKHPFFMLLLFCLTGFVLWIFIWDVPPIFGVKLIPTHRLLANFDSNENLYSKENISGNIKNNLGAEGGVRISNAPPMKRPNLLKQPDIGSKLKGLVAAFPVHRNTSFDTYQLDVTLSDRISLDRNVPDTRNTKCRARKYNTETLPKVSVIIPFHNEAWSMLLRGLHSVINRTPDELLQEIIMVDDASTFPYLKTPLENYIAVLPKTRMIRQSVRKGLMVTRMVGARNATGDVLVFLDAHIECNVNWLEPLLAEIRKNRKIIAIPHVDTIDTKSLRYMDWKTDLHGGFSWKLDYVWKHPPSRLLNSRASPVDPIPSPTLIGCVIAIDRGYFFEIGAFDEGMQIWGGENLEISFRTWMCGGALYIVPCSRVGHMFRAFLPYTFPSANGRGGHIIQRNLQRVAEVWMDEYKWYFYAATSKAKFTQEDHKSLYERHKLRNRLKCHNFTWYLNNVIPEVSVPTPDSVYFGQIKNVATWWCLTVVDNKLVMKGCARHLPDQDFHMNMRGQLVHNGSCVVHDVTRNVMKLEQCNDADLHQLWFFDTNRPDTVRLDNTDWKKPSGRLYPRHNLEKKGMKPCYTHVTIRDPKTRVISGQLPMAIECQKDSSFQFWVFSYRFDPNILKKIGNKNI